MKRFDTYRDGQLILKNQTMTPAVEARLVRMVAAADHEVRIVNAVPPPVPNPPQHPPGARCVYFSNVTQPSISRLCQLGRGYTALFSADLNESVPGGAYYVSGTQIAMLKDAGVIVGSWCDCSATPYTAAQRMADQRNLAFAGGQAEDEGQYLEAIGGGARHIIGNPANLGNSLRDAIALSNKGAIAFIGEVMAPDPSYSAQGVNITSACFYIDRDANVGGYIPLAAYENMPAGLRAGCSIYTGGRMTSDDWDTYAAWTKP